MKIKLMTVIAGVGISLHAGAQGLTDFSHDVRLAEKPWTNTNFNNKTEDFRFAIVSDRTNGHRPGVFKGAIDKLNQLNPEFVLSVGDFIEGYTADTVELNRQWAEFDGLIKPLQMPFFMVPGNHDLSNDVQASLWKRKYGPAYYHFTYKNVLFLILNSNDGDGTPFTEKQLAYAENVLKSNPSVRWTFVLMHHPVWNNRDNNGFSRVEKALGNRQYTVIAGHTHRYLHSVHSDQNYYILGTTGGSTRLRGDGFGETDHISWVSMSGKGPSLVNLRLDGILAHDFSNTETRLLGQSLSDDTASRPFLLLPAGGNSGKGKAFLHFNNSSDLPRNAHWRITAHPRVGVSEDPLNLTLPPRSEKTVALDLLPLNNSTLSGDSIDVQWKIAYLSDKKGLPALDGTHKLPLRPSVPVLINTDVPVFTSSAQVEVANKYSDCVIRYTLDGTEPDWSSPKYITPFTINETTTVKAKVFTAGGTAESATETAIFRRLKFIPAANVNNKKLRPGLQYTYYEGAFKSIPDFFALKPVKSGVLKSFELDVIKERPNQFALLANGYINIAEDNLYTFYLTSDDGSKLFIDDRLVVDNDGSHSARTRSGFAALRKGLHKIRLEYFEDFDGELIRLEYSGKENLRKEVAFSRLFY